MIPEKLTDAQRARVKALLKKAKERVAMAREYRKTKKQPTGSKIV